MTLVSEGKIKIECDFMTDIICKCSFVSNFFKMTLNVDEFIQV